MLISSTKRQLHMSPSGRLRGADVGVEIGPGKYTSDHKTIAGSRATPSFSSFGSAGRNLAPVREGPGPAKFQRDQFSFKEPNSDNPSFVFRSKRDRFAQPPRDTTDLGPGIYKPQKSAFDSQTTKHKNRRKYTQSRYRVQTSPSAPSVPRSSQSFGYTIKEDGTVSQQKPPQTGYGGTKLANPYQPNDRTQWIKLQLKDTVGPAYYDRPETFANARANTSAPGKTVSKEYAHNLVLSCFFCQLIPYFLRRGL